jgi:hypothetical protein
VKQKVNNKRHENLKSIQFKQQRCQNTTASKQQICTHHTKETKYRHNKAPKYQSIKAPMHQGIKASTHQRILDFPASATKSLKRTHVGMGDLTVAKQE